MSEEAKLLASARRLEEEALATIYDEYSPGLYRYAYRNCGDINQAEDCVSETFSRFLQALKREAGPRKSLKAYLYRIAHNWIIDSYRRGPPPENEFTDKLKLVEETSLDENVESAIQAEVLRKALAKLTKAQHQVIGLKFLEGWSNKEIAEATGKPVGAVKALQSRALGSLKRILRDENF